MHINISKGFTVDNLHYCRTLAQIIAYRRRYLSTRIMKILISWWELATNGKPRNHRYICWRGGVNFHSGLMTTLTMKLNGLEILNELSFNVDFFVLSPILKAKQLWRVFVRSKLSPLSKKKLIWGLLLELNSKYH